MNQKINNNVKLLTRLQLRRWKIGSSRTSRNLSLSHQIELYLGMDRYGISDIFYHTIYHFENYNMIKFITILYQNFTIFNYTHHHYVSLLLLQEFFNALKKKGQIKLFMSCSLLPLSKIKDYNHTHIHTAFWTLGW